jgi:hypothetical protein
MDAVTLLRDLTARGVRIRAIGDRLEITAPKALATPEMRKRIAAHKTELLAALRQEAPGNGQAQDRSVPPAQDEAQELRQALLAAQDWQALDAVLERAQAAFQAGELPAQAVEELARKAAQVSRRLPEQAGEQRLSELLRRQPVVRVWSRILNEYVLWARDGVEVPAGNTLVVYRESELRQVVGRTPDRVKAIHQAKRALDGELSEAGQGEEGIDAVDPILDDETCYACGCREWWFRADGERICRLCHPPPGE